MYVYVCNKDDGTCQEEGLVKALSTPEAGPRHGPRCAGEPVEGWFRV